MEFLSLKRSFKNFVLSESVMGFENFSIKLVNYTGFFSPGQTLVGTVHITNTKVENFTGIKLKCCGFAEVKFPGKTRREYSLTNEEYFQAEEKYFDAEFCLYNPGHQAFELKVGQHEYPFTFVLPTQIPSSFEGPYGHVRYNLRAVAKRPWFKGEYDCSVNLVIRTPLDLNTIPDAALPVKRMKSKSLGLFCCTSGPIIGQARIERAGFVPGETILLNADAENQSGVSMRGSKAQFVQIVTYLAEGEKKKDYNILHTYSHSDFVDVDIMENVPFAVPIVAPSNLPFCGIINVSYQIQYAIDPGTFSINLTVPLDVIIGTIPLFNYLPLATSFPPPGTSQLNNWSIPTASREDLTASAPPPTYEESIQARNLGKTAKLQ